MSKRKLGRALLCLPYALQTRFWVSSGDSKPAQNVGKIRAPLQTRDHLSDINVGTFVLCLEILFDVGQRGLIPFELGLNPLPSNASICPLCSRRTANSVFLLISFPRYFSLIDSEVISSPFLVIWRWMSATLCSTVSR